MNIVAVLSDTSDRLHHDTGIHLGLYKVVGGFQAFRAEYVDQYQGWSGQLVQFRFGLTLSRAQVQQFSLMNPVFAQPQKSRCNGSAEVPQHTMSKHC